MSKLAVIFPGMGYTADRALLYYAGKAAESCGYKRVSLSFSEIGWSKEDLSDHKKIMEMLNKCIKLVERDLSGYDLEGEKDILFISKSVGTLVAAAFAKKKGIKVKHIFFTPLKAIDRFIPEKSGIVFYGGHDPISGAASIKEVCGRLHLEAHLIKGGNHSLETGDIETDLDNLKKVILKVEDFLSDKNIYDYKVLARDGAIVPISDYRGKVLLIVNTATGCGFTPQYEKLESIYRSYRKDGFEILDFPCNQFGRQAPGNSNTIHSFCTARYDISFTQFRKCDVNGKNELELYSFLKKEQGFHGFEENQDADFLKKKLSVEAPDYEQTSDIKWNFTKFLVDREGKVVARFEPTDDLNGMERKIKGLL